MRTPPESPLADDVLRLVRSAWEPDAAQATYLPVGFGAHHWRIDGPSGPALFATLDVPTGFRTTPLTRAAYRGVVELAEAGFSGAVAPRLTTTGDVAVTAGNGLLSATPWLEGRSPDEVEARGSAHARRVAALLADLHRCPAPPSAPTWTPRVASGFAERLMTKLSQPWTAGPLSEEAHRTISRARRPPRVGETIRPTGRSRAQPPPRLGTHARRTPSREPVPRRSRTASRRLGDARDRAPRTRHSRSPRRSARRLHDR